MSTNNQQQQEGYEVLWDRESERWQQQQQQQLERVLFEERERRERGGRTEESSYQRQTEERLMGSSASLRFSIRSGMSDRSFEIESEATANQELIALQYTQKFNKVSHDLECDMTLRQLHDLKAFKAKLQTKDDEIKDLKETLQKLKSMEQAQEGESEDMCAQLHEKIASLVATSETSAKNIRELAEVKEALEKSEMNEMVLYEQLEVLNKEVECLREEIETTSRVTLRRQITAPLEEELHIARLTISQTQFESQKSIRENLALKQRNDFLEASFSGLTQSIKELTNEIEESQRQKRAEEEQLRHTAWLQSQLKAQHEQKLQKLAAEEQLRHTACLQSQLKARHQEKLQQEQKQQQQMKNMSLALMRVQRLRNMTEQSVFYTWAHHMAQRAAEKKDIAVTNAQCELMRMKTTQEELRRIKVIKVLLSHSPPPPSPLPFPPPSFQTHR
jgi:hypothetical protein